MRVALVLIFINSLTVFGQNLPKEAEKIVREGKVLYRSEMAAWHGTDLFLAAYADQANIGGYFAYPDKDSTKCVFVSRENESKIIGTVSLDSLFNLETATVNLTIRDFSKREKEYYSLRKVAKERIGSDTTFVTYSYTNYNIIPLISGKEKKVYVLTAPTKSGLIIFGNDYLISCNKKGKVKSVKTLHANILPMEFGKSEDGEAEVGSMHSHTDQTGDFITPTDICTLMLYAKYAGWEQHVVISEKYMNTWNCITNELIVIPTATMKKIQEDMETREKGED